MGGIEVATEDFVSNDVAAKRLGVSVPAIKWRSGWILHPAYLSDGSEGVTRASLEAEVEWQKNARWWKRLIRGVGGVLRWF